MMVYPLQVEISGVGRDFFTNLGLHVCRCKFFARCSSWWGQVKTLVSSNHALKVSCIKIHRHPILHIFFFLCVIKTSLSLILFTMPINLVYTRGCSQWVTSDHIIWIWWHSLYITYSFSHFERMKNQESFEKKRQRFFCTQWSFQLGLAFFFTFVSVCKYKCV